MRLSTSNPFDAPLIDPGFFSNDLDMAIMIEAVKASQRYVATSSWSNFIGAPYIDSANTTTPEGIIEYTRQRTATTRHPTGTAQVGKVVNGDLTVKDISGVRIVDASIFVSNLFGRFWTELLTELLRSHMFHRPIPRPLPTLLLNELPT